MKVKLPPLFPNAGAYTRAANRLRAKLALWREPSSRTFRATRNQQVCQHASHVDETKTALHTMHFML